MLLKAEMLGCKLEGPVMNLNSRDYKIKESYCMIQGETRDEWKTETIIFVGDNKHRDIN